MDDSTFTIGCVQTTACADVEKSLEEAERGILEAIARGASFIMTPENVAGMLPNGTSPHAIAYGAGDHPCLRRFSHLAKQHGIWLVAGSVTIRPDDGEEDTSFVNRCYVFSPSGEIVAHYDKIHLFDVDLGNGEHYTESRFYRGGHHAVLVDMTAHGTATTDAVRAKLGLTICYDVRFPHLFRRLAQGGAHMISVPSAFTRHTGKAHWETLLRSRAIENGVYIVAAAQCGDHGGGRKTWGHSLIIDPWGTILAQGDGDSPCVITAPFRQDVVSHVRTLLPCHRHHRPFTLSSGES